MASILRRGPLLLVFYSGSWCPGCNLGLKALEEVRPLIEARGASLVASSPQTIEGNTITRRTTQVTLPILSDKGGKIALQFGVRCRILELLQTLHLKSGIDLPSLRPPKIAPRDLSWTRLVPASGPTLRCPRLSPGRLPSEHRLCKKSLTESSVRSRVGQFAVCVADPSRHDSLTQQVFKTLERAACEYCPLRLDRHAMSSDWKQQIVHVIGFCGSAGMKSGHMNDKRGNEISWTRR